MTCQHCGKESPEGTKPATQAWCVDCQKALLAPPESFLGYPRVDVETQGNAKWEYRLRVTGYPDTWKIVEVRVYQPGKNYKIWIKDGRYPTYIKRDSLIKHLKGVADALLKEAQGILQEKQDALREAMQDCENAERLFDQLSGRNSDQPATIDFWDRLDGVE